MVILCPAISIDRVLIDGFASPPLCSAVRSQPSPSSGSARDLIRSHINSRAESCKEYNSVAFSGILLAIRAWNLQYCGGDPIWCYKNLFF
ncbi:hypothetical protein IEQ34_005939 [Dendrobium chrysotoxum]|uniref:Uncharacterized protein n=1 Tax=Dendrobium chrysotoxum TaxID=161865 RepID=A0AAV7HA99_DENCH|nr:hypothetical protein IEQ34_005939 [Dendrobium chrysotoxum]